MVPGGLVDTTICLTNSLSNQQFAKTTVCQNNSLPNQQFAKPTICQTNNLLKGQFVMITICSNASFPNLERFIFSQIIKALPNICKSFHKRKIFDNTKVDQFYFVFLVNGLFSQLTFCQIVFSAFCLLGRKVHAPIFKVTEIQFEAQSQFEQKKIAEPVKFFCRDKKPKGSQNVF